MFDFIQGSLIALAHQQIIIQVGGIGYSLQVPDEHSFVQGQEVKLHVHMHWNQENGPSLFGFQNALDKQVFQLIISCSGIGPKIGLAVLAHMSAGSFVSIVSEGDVKGLSAVNGIGAKKAENMILQLRDKVSKLVASGVQLGSDGAQARNLNQVSEVLESLSYSRPEIASALEFVKKNEGLTQLSFDGLLRKALGYLSKRV